MPSLETVPEINIFVAKSSPFVSNTRFLELLRPFSYTVVPLASTHFSVFIVQIVYQRFRESQWFFTNKWHIEGETSIQSPKNRNSTFWVARLRRATKFQIEPCSYLTNQRVHSSFIVGIPYQIFTKCQQLIFPLTRPHPHIILNIILLHLTIVFVAIFVFALALVTKLATIFTVAFVTLAHKFELQVIRLLPNVNHLLTDSSSCCSISLRI